MTLLLFTLFSSISAEETKLQGFLYEVDEHTWVLASQPNLKSCCLHKHSPTFITSKAPFPKTTQPVTVTGELTELDGRTTLIATTITPHQKPFPWLTLSALSLLVLLWYSRNLGTSVLKRKFQNFWSWD